MPFWGWIFTPVCISAISCGFKWLGHLLKPCENSGFVNTKLPNALHRPNYMIKDNLCRLQKNFSSHPYIATAALICVLFSFPSPQLVFQQLVPFVSVTTAKFAELRDWAVVIAQLTVCAFISISGTKRNSTDCWGMGTVKKNAWISPAAAVNG